MNVELLEEYQRLCAIKHSLTTKVAEQERSKESLSEELQAMKKEVEKLEREGRKTGIVNVTAF